MSWLYICWVECHGSMKKKGNSNQKCVFWRVKAFGGAWKNLRLRTYKYLVIICFLVFFCAVTGLIYTFSNLLWNLYESPYQWRNWIFVRSHCQKVFFSCIIAIMYVLHWSAIFWLILLSTYLCKYRKSDVYSFGGEKK